MAYYLGIDGGGTKTRCVLADDTAVLATTMAGGSSILRQGEEQARQAIRAAVTGASSAARIPLSDVCAVCIGVTGAARPQISEKIRGIVAGILPHLAASKIEVAGDTVIALDAAFGEAPGVIVIAGTGSIAYGRNATGETARAGGWGFAISDEGSGHWIGRRSVSAILDLRDQGKTTLLEAAVLGAWKLNSLDELIQHANATPAPDFPRLFPVVLQAAEQGDDAAQGLLVEAGVALARLVETVTRRLGGAIPVATTGSVFRQSVLVRQVFGERLRENIPDVQLREEPVEPVDGALARARRL